MALTTTIRHSSFTRRLLTAGTLSLRLIFTYAAVEARVWTPDGAGTWHVF
jgi:hypothetical protein